MLLFHVFQAVGSSLNREIVNGAFFLCYLRRLRCGGGWLGRIRLSLPKEEEMQGERERESKRKSEEGRMQCAETVTES